MKAVDMLPRIVIDEAKLSKTGTADVPENTASNLTANLTENPVKIQQNTVKSNKSSRQEKQDNDNVTNCNKKGYKKAGERIRTADVQLGKLALTPPLSQEPSTSPTHICEHNSIR